MQDPDAQVVHADVEQDQADSGLRVQSPAEGTLSAQMPAEARRQNTLDVKSEQPGAGERRP